MDDRVPSSARSALVLTLFLFIILNTRSAYALLRGIVKTSFATSESNRNLKLPDKSLSSRLINLPSVLL